MPVHTHQFRQFVRPRHKQFGYVFEERCRGWERSLSDERTLVKKTFNGSQGPFGTRLTEKREWL
jgi:hypothetical protein